MIPILPFLPEYFQGMLTTLQVSLLAFLGSLVLGTLGAVARRSQWRLLRIIATVYVEVIRNTPALVQIFIIFFGLPSFGIVLPALWAGAVALAINAGAYNTEIIRAGLAAVPRGQLEAATTLGLSKVSAFFSVIFPQAMRTVYPPIINEFIGIVLATSLLSVIGLNELTGVAQVVNAVTFATIGAFTVALIMYLILTNAIAFLAALFARAVFKPPIDIVPRQSWRPAFLSSKIGAQPRGGAE